MFNKKIKNFFKKNLNKILVLVIYVIMFYGVSNLLSVILKDFAVEHNQQLLCSTIINVFLYGVLLASCLILLKTEIKTDFEVLNKKKNRFVYKRELDGKAYIIDCNLDKEETVAYAMPSGYKCILDTKNGCTDKLGAYEARIWKKEM